MPLKKRKAAAPFAMPGKFGQRTLRQEVQRLVRGNNERVPRTRQMFENEYDRLAHKRSIRGAARLSEMLRKEVERKNPKLYSAIKEALEATMPKKGGVLRGIIIFGGTARGYPTPKDIDYSVVTADPTPEFETSKNHARDLHNLLRRRIKELTGVEAEFFEKMRFVNLENLANTVQFAPAPERPWFFMGDERALKALIRAMEDREMLKPR